MGSRFIQITGLSAGRWTCSLTPAQRLRDLSGHNSVLLQFKGVTIFFLQLQRKQWGGKHQEHISEEDLYVKSHQDERWKRSGGRSIRILTTVDLIGSDWLSDICVLSGLWHCSCGVITVRFLLLQRDGDLEKRDAAVHPEETELSSARSNFHEQVGKINFSSSDRLRVSYYYRRLWIITQFCSNMQILFFFYGNETTKVPPEFEKLCVTLFRWVWPSECFRSRELRTSISGGDHDWIDIFGWTVPLTSHSTQTRLQHYFQNHHCNFHNFNIKIWKVPSSSFFTQHENRRWTFLFCL